AVLLIAAGLYTATCAPGPLWQDSGMYQYRIWHNDIEGNLGLALSHPLYHIIGIGAKHIPIGEFGYRINMLTALISAVAVANLFLLLRLWLGSTFSAVIGAATLALSHTFWRHATIAETYNLYIALLLAELIVLLQYLRTKRIGLLYALGLFNGLAIANHMLASVGLVCYTVLLATLLLRKQISFRSLGIIVVLWIAGAGPYEYLIIKNILQTGDLSATLTSALFGTSWQADVLNTSLSAGLVKENLIFIAYNFPTPNIILFFAGLYGLKKVSPGRSFTNILLALSILFFVFAFRYTVPDRYAFFIPFYCLASILIGVGFHSLVAVPGRKILCWVVLVFTLLPIPTYIIAPVLAEKAQFNISTRADVPYRNDYTWFLRPWRTGYRGAEKFADDVFEKLEPDAVVYADNTMVYPLLYMQQVNGKRADIRIISKYASSQGLPLLSEKFLKQWLTEGDVFSVSPIERHKGEGIIWKIDD
ncbi:MAG: protein O-mannosyl-transferase family, partial [Planctomycetota bacterium]